MEDSKAPWHAVHCRSTTRCLEASACTQNSGAYWHAVLFRAARSQATHSLDFEMLSSERLHAVLWSILGPWSRVALPHIFPPGSNLRFAPGLACERRLLTSTSPSEIPHLGGRPYGGECHRIPCIPLPECRIDVFGKTYVGYVFRFFRKAKGPKRPRHSGREGIHGITRKSVKIRCECRSVPWHRKPGPYLLTHTKLARGGK